MICEKCGGFRYFEEVTEYETNVDGMKYFICEMCKTTVKVVK